MARRMPEHDALVFEYSHLKSLPRGDEALHSLQKIASLVKPIMRARNWKVGILAEFYPDQQNLLGINQNRGQKICLRLRYPGDKNQFLPLEQVVDTMLHELSHNVHGPHNAEFHALWDQLRREYEALLAKGYTGEGFLSEGHKLGGKRVPRDEARRIARTAAEKRRTLYAGSGQRLGGAPVRAGTDIREVIVGAIERRNTVLKGCGSDNKNEKEIQELGDQATQNGFRTKAEEDKANDSAIAQALWELVQEDEKKERGDSYIPPSPANPMGNGGSQISSHSLFQKPTKSSTAPPTPYQSSSPPAREAPPVVSRLVAEAAAKSAKKSKSTTLVKKETKKESETFIPVPNPPKASTTTGPALTGWTCPICTLHNRIEHLACDACTVERPEEISRKIAEDARRNAAAAQKQTRTWRCHRCSTIMEDTWWTCGTCGTMKQSS